jgi:hypothetical protein
METQTRAWTSIAKIHCTWRTPMWNPRQFLQNAMLISPPGLVMATAIAVTTTKLSATGTAVTAVLKLAILDQLTIAKLRLTAKTLYTV